MNSDVFWNPFLKYILKKSISRFSIILLKIEKYFYALEGCLFIPKISVVAQFPPV
jgi:hypothetical protein